MIGNALNRRKTLAFAGLAACALTASAFVAMPSAGRLEARERSTPPSCRTQQVALDQGYGVTRVAERRVCDEP